MLHVCSPDMFHLLLVPCSVAVMTKGYPSIQRKDLVLLQEIAGDKLLACGAVYVISVSLESF
jgi:hypothetical protein